MQIAHQFREACLQVVRGIGRHARIPGFRHACPRRSRQNEPADRAARSALQLHAIDRRSANDPVHARNLAAHPASSSATVRKPPTMENDRSTASTSRDQFGTACFNDGPSQRHLRRIGFRMSSRHNCCLAAEARSPPNLARSNLERSQDCPANAHQIPLALRPHVGRWPQECDFCRRCWRGRLVAGCAFRGSRLRRLCR